jgi:hypothetical protein
VKITKSIAEKQASLSNVLESIDDVHVEFMNELSEYYYVRDFGSSINGILLAYSTIVSLLSYEKTLKPVSFLPGVNPSVIEECISGKRSLTSLNPHVALLISAFIEHKGVKAEDVLRTYDHIRRTLINKTNYGEKIVAGLMYDLTILRLCTISKFSDALFRPILFDQKDFQSICRSIHVDLPSALDYVKKTRPIMSTVSSMALDAYKIINGEEVLDFLIPIASGYFSTLVLRTERTSLFLKDYLAILRQASLLRLVFNLVYLGDDVLRNSLKAFIERWVTP